MSHLTEVIYETPDEPVKEEPVKPEVFESENVEKIHLDLDSAFKRFAGRIISAEDVDFSTIANRRRPKGYRAGQYVIEFVGPEYDQAETPEQRFNRLRIEIDELKDQICNGQENVKSDVFLTKDQLDSLTQQLERIEINKTADPTTKPSSSGAAKPANTSYSMDPKIVSRFEARVRKLEQALGVVDATTLDSRIPEPLVNALDELRVRIEAMHPKTLEQCEGKLNTILAKHQKMQDGEAQNEFQQRVDELYQFMHKFQGSSDTISAVVKRLQTLAQLHEQAQEFSTKLNELHSAKTQLRENMAANKEMVNTFAADFKKMMDSMRSELDQVKKQMN